MTHALEWPSLTVQWLPDETRPDSEEIDVHKAILGTHTSSGDQDYLMIANISLPSGQFKFSIYILNI